MATVKHAEGMAMKWARYEVVVIRTDDWDTEESFARPTIKEARDTAKVLAAGRYPAPAYNLSIYDKKNDQQIPLPVEAVA